MDDHHFSYITKLGKKTLFIMVITVEKRAINPTWSNVLLITISWQTKCVGLYDISIIVRSYVVKQLENNSMSNFDDLVVPCPRFFSF